MEIPLEQLQTNTTYHVQVRATGPNTLSEFSPIFTFTTGADTVGPSAPTNPAVTIQGGSMIVTWTKPSTNSDGTPLRDLDLYRVEATANGITKTFISLTERFEFTHINNSEAFGSFQSPVIFNIYALDTMGNPSLPATTTGTKPKPGKVTALVVTPQESDFTAKWTPPAGEVKDYQVVVTDAAGNTARTYYVTTPVWNFTREENTAWFVTYQPTIKVTVRTRDEAHQLSDPETVTAANALPKPPVITSWASVGTSFVARWTAPTQNTDNTPLTDLAGYEVSVLYTSGTTSTKVYNVLGTEFTLSYEQNKSDFGGVNNTAKTPLALEIRAIDSVGLKSAAATHAAVGNPAPAKAATPVGSATVDAINLSWAANTEDDLAGYEVWLASTAAAGDLGSKVATTVSNSYVHQTVGWSTDHYFYVKAVDTFGTAGPGSDKTPALKPKNAMVVNTSNPATPSAPTITKTLTYAADKNVGFEISWPAVANPENDLAGYIVRWRKTAGTVYEYLDVPPDVTAARIVGLAETQGYLISVRAYDYSTNKSPFSAETSGTTGAGKPDQEIPEYPVAPAPTTSPTPTVKTLYGALELRWPVINDGDPSIAYEVHVSATSGFAATTVTTKAVEARGTYAIIRSLPDGTQLANETDYFVRIRAKNPQGAAAPGPEITAKTGVISGNDIAVNSVSAAVLKADTAFNQNLTVGSKFTLGTSTGGVGSIESFNYNGSTTGFQLTSSGLNILSGTVAARALQIQEGANIVPAMYAGFEFTSTSYTGNIESNTTWSIASGGKFESQALQATASGYVYLAPTSAQANANIPVEPSTTYILSYYDLLVSGTATASPRVRKNGTADTGSSWTGAAAVLNTWTRRTYTFTTAANDTMASIWFEGTGGGVYKVDGIQLERQIGSATTASQWKPPGVTTIDGGIIRTGQIRSKDNITDALQGDVGQPLWSINTQGNMQIGSAVVRGKLVVGQAGSSSNVNVSSHTYGTTGANQWAIKGDGTFEIRGNGGTSTSAVVLDSNGLRAFNGTYTTVNINAATGNVAFATSNNALRFDDTGLKLFSGVTETVALNSDGTAKFTGDVTAAGGKIANWVIAPNTLTGGSLVIDSSSGKISSGSGSTTVAMRASEGFWAGGTAFADAPFSVTPAGALKSNSGTIGGFTISGTEGLYAGSNTTRVQMKSNEGFWAGADARDSAPFRVTPAGKLTATGVEISGALTATSGSFSGTVYASAGSFKGDIYAGVFYSRTLTSGTKQWIEIGTSGSNDFVDEIRMFSSDIPATIRNPGTTGNQGSMIISTARSTSVAGYVYNFHHTSGFSTGGGDISTGTGSISTTSGSISTTSGNITSTSGNIQGENVYADTNMRASGNMYADAYFTPGSTTSTRYLSSPNTYILRIGDNKTGGGTREIDYTTKTFVINHPTPEKSETHYLVHSAIEGPTADVLYRGTGRLEDDRHDQNLSDIAKRLPRVEITLPDYFEDLTEVEGRTVTLTPIVGFCDNEDCQIFLPGALGCSKIIDGKFTVYALGPHIHHDAEFYWEVKAVRKDVPQHEVEPRKTEYTLNGDGPYTYLTRNAPRTTRKKKEV